MAQCLVCQKNDATAECRACMLDVCPACCVTTDGGALCTKCGERCGGCGAWLTEDDRDKCAGCGRQFCFAACLVRKGDGDYSCRQCLERNQKT